MALPALREVSLAEDGDSVPRNFVDASGTGRFHDVCCGRGESVAGISFCDYQPSEPRSLIIAFAVDWTTQRPGKHLTAFMFCCSG